MAQSRRIVWLNVVTVVSAAILIGAEVFGAAFASSWAVATLFDLGGLGARVLDILFVLCGIAIMSKLWPVIFLPVLLQRVRGWRARGVYLGIALLPALAALHASKTHTAKINGLFKICIPPFRKFLTPENCSLRRLQALAQMLEL